MSTEDRKEALQRGQLQLQDLDINHRDVKRIFMKLKSGRSQPRWTCQHLGKGISELGKIERLLSSDSNIRIVDLTCNPKIGDKVAEYLHILPDTVLSLSIVGSKVSTQGLKRVCKFLETNNIMRMFVMDGINGVDHEGVKYIGKMLSNNSKLQSLFYVGHL